MKPIKLTQVEVKHLIQLLADCDHFYGPKEQYEKRAVRIMEKLEDAISDD